MTDLLEFFSKRGLVRREVAGLPPLPPPPIVLKKPKFIKAPRRSCCQRARQLGGSGASGDSGRHGFGGVGGSRDSDPLWLWRRATRRLRHLGGTCARHLDCFGARHLGGFDVNMVGGLGARLGDLVSILRCLVPLPPELICTVGSAGYGSTAPWYISLGGHKVWWLSGGRSRRDCGQPTSGLQGHSADTPS